MRPPRFLVGKLPNGEQRRASIDPSARYLEAEIAERRFSAYLKPFVDEQDARAALVAAGAERIELEDRKRGKRRG